MLFVLASEGQPDGAASSKGEVAELYHYCYAFVEYDVMICITV